MLHEVLLALQGIPGSIFVMNEQGDMRLVPDLPFISSAEEFLLNGLCELGSHYRRFQDFIQTHNGCPAVTQAPKTDDTESLRPGLYLKAFCDGLDSVLDPYRKSLLDVEQSILADQHLTAAFVRTALDSYRPLFPFLASVIEQITSQKAHGCHILDILHKNAAHGLPIVKAALQKTIHSCHGVLYKQLASWMLHGLLLDKHEEFFIQRIPPTKPKQEVQVEEDELGLGGVTGRMLQQMLQISQGMNMSSSANEHFSIRGELLPCYITVRVAEKILFVGESVQMFASERKVTSMKRAGSSILKNKEEFFARALHELSKESEFSMREFEECIDRIRTCVAEHLWTLVVEESNLFEQLKILKDFLLLGRGELFLAFIDQAQNLLKAPPTTTTQHDVNAAFHQAARNVLLEDDYLLQKFQLVVDTKTQSKKLTKQDAQSDAAQSGPPTPETGWSVLSLDYKVEWPLHILFTQGVLDKYNTIFRFLLAVKRVQLELQNCWSLQMQEKKGKSSSHAAVKWLLRTHMAFLVDNLQYYLQVDVIESQYSILLDKIQATRDFEAIRLSHDQFITALLAQSFQLMKPVSNCLNEILDTCHNFCVLVTHGDSSGPEWEIEQLDVITKNFQRQSNLLFRILSSVRSHQASPHLAQLLLRIDFNKYFSMSGGQLGSYTSTMSISSGSRR